MDTKEVERSTKRKSIALCANMFAMRTLQSAAERRSLDAVMQLNAEKEVR
jgi:hypothetical protein